MKLQNKIEIDILDFFRTGKFDCIRLGQSKEWILNNFPNPDNFNDDFLNSKINIWTYQSIEFHFDKSNKLFLIYSDYLEDFNGGKNLKINKWILSDFSKLSLANTLTELNKEEIDYCKSSDGFSVKLELESGVILGFSKESEEKDTDPNKWHITYFSLINQ